MTVAPTCASTERDCPDASMKVILGIEMNFSLGKRRFAPDAPTGLDAGRAPS
jgi:hypothetical protein